MTARVGRRSRAPWALLGCALAFAGCEPSGPGTLTARVNAPAPTGAVVLEIVGEGVTGFEGTGDARTLSAPISASGATNRLVVVSPTGQLTFDVAVEDVSAPLPSGTIVSAVDLQNQPVPSLVGYSLRFAH